MRVGVSTYSLLPAIRAGEMTVLDVVDWIAENGGQHMEIVPYGFTLEDNPGLADAVRERAAKVGIALSNYSMPANFVQESRDAFDVEVERIKRHVDTVNRLGMKHMRHDVTAFTLPPEKMGIDYVETHLDMIVEGCRLIADYADFYGITTTIENHGVSVQASDRVQRVLQAVDRLNFKTTLDIGNFLCVDEQPLVGVKRNLPFASLIHVKDFYYRPFDQDPGGGNGSEHHTAITFEARSSARVISMFAGFCVSLRLKVMTEILRWNLRAWRSAGKEPGWVWTI